MSTTLDPDKNRGLYGKYHVQKITHRPSVCPWSPNGSHNPTVTSICHYCHGAVPLTVTELVDPDGPVFVLAFTKDPHAAVALAAYAESCAAEYPKLAADLREALRGQPECECHEPACQWCEIHGETGNPPLQHDCDDVDDYEGTDQ